MDCEFDASLESVPLPLPNIYLCTMASKQKRPHSYYTFVLTGNRKQSLMGILVSPFIKDLLLQTCNVYDVSLNHVPGVLLNNNYSVVTDLVTQCKYSGSDRIKENINRLLLKVNVTRQNDNNKLMSGASFRCASLQDVKKVVQNCLVEFRFQPICQKDHDMIVNNDSFKSLDGFMVAEYVGRLLPPLSRGNGYRLAFAHLMKSPPDCNNNIMDVCDSEEHFERLFPFGICVGHDVTERAKDAPSNTILMDTFMTTSPLEALLANRNTAFTELVKGTRERAISLNEEYGNDAITEDLANGVVTTFVKAIEYTGLSHPLVYICDEDTGGELRKWVDHAAAKKVLGDEVHRQLSTNTVTVS